MRGINYPAAFGTILIFIGIFCFKAAFGKQSVTKGKALWILAGSLSFLPGVFLLVKAILKITR
jgi:hypothetical protein